MTLELVSAHMWLIGLLGVALGGLASGQSWFQERTPSLAFGGIVLATISVFVFVIGCVVGLAGTTVSTLTLIFQYGQSLVEFVIGLT